MIQFITANWLWIVAIVAMVAMHRRGGCGSHGGHGGHGGHGHSQRAPDERAADAGRTGHGSHL